MTPGIVAESDLSGVLKSEYVFFDGERAARRDLPAGTVAYYFSDHLKTASVITDAAGNIKSESDYYPGDGELQFLANDSNHYKFTGKERDETGLDYFGARYYSNGLGRFITPDWSSTPIPVPYADFGDPQSLNQYSYVKNVPTVKTDPDGHCCDLNDAINFVAGLGNALGSNSALGAGRVEQTSNAGRMGQAVGDAVSTVQGTAEVLFGGGVEVAGFTLDGTIIGAPAGVVLNVAGAGIIAHGATTALVGGIHLSQDSKQGGSSSTHQDTQENIDKMDKGKAPTGNDGNPVEVHHEGQQSDGQLKPMTRTDHRLGETFKKNHPNTGQQKSQINRTDFAKQRKQFWKNQAKKAKEDN